MPPAAKKRKTTAGASRSSVAPTFKQGIQAFGKISKPQPTRIVKKEPVYQISVVEPNGRELHVASDNGNKRKFVVTPEPGAPNDAYFAPSKTLSSINAQETLANALQPAQRSPDSRSHRSRVNRRTVVASLKTNDTPTKGARSSLESFATSSSPPTVIASSSSSPTQDSPPTSPVSAESPRPIYHNSKSLPESLLDLINLHAAFLSALSLYYVHNGTLSPANVQSLKPSIERLWGKRVSTEDLRRVIALSQQDLGRLGSVDSYDNGTFLSLSDYGSGRVCVEIASEHRHQGIHRRPIDEEIYNAKFAETLTRLWEIHDSSCDPVLPSSAFISSLPLAPIVPCSSLSKISSLIAKGQHRLSYLKAPPTQAQKSDTLGLAKKSLPTAPTSRSLNLLSRIKAKQLYQSTLPCAPSREELARKSAMQRLEEVVPVLEILTSSAGQNLHQSSLDNTYAASATKEHRTHSITLPTLVQHLQMSLRNPISKDEAVACVKLLADDIAPEWVGMREVGKCMGIMIRPGKAVGREELRRRVGKC